MAMFSQVAVNKRLQSLMYFSIYFLSVIHTKLGQSEFRITTDHILDVVAIILFTKWCHRIYT